METNCTTVKEVINCKPYQKLYTYLLCYMLLCTSNYVHTSMSFTQRLRRSVLSDMPSHYRYTAILYLYPGFSFPDPFIITFTIPGIYYVQKRNYDSPLY